MEIKIKVEFVETIILKFRKENLQFNKLIKF